MKENELPPCEHRRRVNGMDMCYAIGCCEVGDMPCECEVCMKENGPKPSFCRRLSRSEQ